MEQADDYAALANIIRKCTKCPLCATRTTVVVDRGDPTAKLMFIGEAPGANEDATGQAFVGRAGALLDELLEEAGIKKFLIVNVLKCRPPNNKFPGDQDAYHPVEVVDECLPWLDKQIELVQPKAIILVGGKAASRTIYRGKKTPAVRDIAGKRMRSEDYPGVDIFGMYHTSYMLRLKNMNRFDYDRLREQTLDVMRAAQRAADGEPVSMATIHVTGRPDRGEQLNFF